MTTMRDYDPELVALAAGVKDVFLMKAMKVGVGRHRTEINRGHDNIAASIKTIIRRTAALEKEGSTDFTVEEAFHVFDNLRVRGSMGAFDVANYQDKNKIGGQAYNLYGRNCSPGVLFAFAQSHHMAQTILESGTTFFDVELFVKGVFDSITSEYPLEFQVQEMLRLDMLARKESKSRSRHYR